MNHSEDTKDFELSASSIQAGLSHFALDDMTEEEWEAFEANLDEETNRRLELMVEKCESAARAYIERYEPELKEDEGDEYILVGLQCHLADMWEQWCDEETAVTPIAEAWIAENVSDFEVSATTVRAIRAYGVLETMTEQELDEFYGELTEATAEELSFVADAALSEASSYITTHRADLIGNDDAMFLLANRLLDTCVDWFGRGSRDAPTRIADDFFTGNWNVSGD